MKMSIFLIGTYFAALYQYLQMKSLINYIDKNRESFAFLTLMSISLKIYKVESKCTMVITIYSLYLSCLNYYEVLLKF